MDTYKPVIRFFTNVQVSDGPTATITEAIKPARSQKNISVHKVTGFDSDGASVMTITKEGVTGKLQRLNPKILNIYCIPHRLQLCVSQAAVNNLDTSCMHSETN